MDQIQEPTHLTVFKKFLKDVESGRIQQFVITAFIDDGVGGMRLINEDSGNLNLVEGMALAKFHDSMSTRHMLMAVTPIPTPPPTKSKQELAKP